MERRSEECLIESSSNQFHPQIQIQADKDKSLDRVSNLPEDILSSILSFLTIRDAAKARILSPKWRHLSAFAPNLHFDLSTLFGTLPKRKVDELGFVRAVDEYLHLCRSPKTYSFKVDYCLGNELASNIDKWINFAMRLQTEKLELKFSDHRVPNTIYSFPYQVISQVKSPQLMDLCITSCTMSQNAFDCVLSGCVNLKFLRLAFCHLPESLNICSSLRMKSLVIYNCLGVEEIQLSVVLTKFEYSGQTIELRFVGHALVEKVYLCLWDPSGTTEYDILSGLANDLPQLPFLSLIGCPIKPGQIPVNISTFHYLKELQLVLLLYPSFDLLSVVFILNASPCLQKLHLALQRHYVHKIHKIQSVIQEISKKFYYNLREVEITGFRDRGNALDLAIYLMNHAVGLKRMIIDFTKKWEISVVNWVDFSSSGWEEDEEKKVQNKDEKEKVQNILSTEKGNVELLVL